MKEVNVFWNKNLIIEHSNKDISHNVYKILNLIFFWKMTDKGKENI